MKEVIIPYLIDDTKIRGQLWVDALYPNGDRYFGRVRVTGGDGFAGAAVRTSMTYSLQCTFQGDDGFNYQNSIEDALLA